MCSRKCSKAQKKGNAETVHRKRNKGLLVVSMIPPSIMFSTAASFMSFVFRATLPCIRLISSIIFPLDISKSVVVGFGQLNTGSTLAVVRNKNFM